MATHKIKIEGVADFSAIAKDVQQISKQISSAFGEKGAKVLDEQSVNFLKTAAPTLIGRVQEELKKLTDEAKAIDKAIKASTKDQKKQEELSKKRLENVRKTVAAEKDLRNLMKAQNIVNNGGQMPEPPKGAANKPNVGGDLPDNVVPMRRKGEKPGFGSVAGKQISHSVQEVAGELPGVAPAMQVGSSAVSAGRAAASAGLGAPAIVALGLVAAAATAAAVAISRMVSGFEVFKQGIPNLLALTGMETQPITDSKTVGEAGALGFGQLEILDIQKQMEQALGKAKTPEQDQNRLLNVLTAARDTGMDPRQILAGADQLRQAGGTEVANKQIAAIMDKAITSGMDKSQAAAFLGSAVSLLTEINQNGTANQAQLLAVMADLVAGGNMSPEQAAKTIAGMSSAIANSSGETNSFFQSAAVEGGLGSGSILGTQFAVRQGLAGVNMGDVEKQVGDTKHGRMGMQAMQEMGLGDKDFTRKFASGILNQIDQRFDTKTKSGREAALGFTGQMFGTKTAAESTKVLAVLEKMKAGTALSKTDKKLLEDLGKDPEASWRENTLQKLDATARSTAAMQAALEKGQFELGKTSSQYINQLNAAMLSLDTTLNKFLNSETFAAIKKGLGEVAAVISSVFGGAFTDLMKLPETLGKIFDNFMADPLEFGKAMGKGFADIVMTTWDFLTSSIKSIIETVTSLFANFDPSTIGEKVKGVFSEGADKVMKFADGFLSGAAEASVDKENTGSVSYTDAQKGMLGDVKQAAKGIATPTGIGMAVRSGSEIYSAVKSGGVQAPAAPAAPQPAAAPAPATDVTPVVEELKKTNQILERSTRPGGAPRAGRETSRP